MKMSDYLGCNMTAMLSEIIKLLKFIKNSIEKKDFNECYYSYLYN